MTYCVHSVICHSLWINQLETNSYHWKHWKMLTMMTLFVYSSVFSSVCVLCSCNYLLPLRINKVHRTCKALVYGKWLTAQCQQLRCCILGSNNANDIVINSVDGSTSCLLSTQMNCCSQFTSCSQVSGLLSNQPSIKCKHFILLKVKWRGDDL